ncbi:MAG: TolC family protein [Longimicrobiales bacterium]
MVALPIRPIPVGSIVLSMFIAFCTVAPAAAQASPGLSLEEAVELARRNNPGYLAQRNDEHVADWNLREAYGSLLPSANAGFGLQYQAEGTQRVGVFTGEDLGIGDSQSYYFSDYSLGLGYSLSGSTFYQIPQARASRQATIARTLAARYTLDAAVTRQYIAALAARAAVALAEAELQRASENLNLAQARVAVGDAIPLEATQAEVERGRAEVELIRARTGFRTERIRLLQQIGIDVDREVELTTEFEVFEPAWTRAELVARAIANNPQLRAEQAAERASAAAVRMAQSAYLPSLDMSLGWAGFTRQAGNSDALIRLAELQGRSAWEQCGLQNQVAERLTSPVPGFPLDCSEFLLTDRQRDLIRADNDVFPFEFTEQPLTFQLRLSLPIFTGFSRQRQIEEAHALEDDATYRARAEELRVQADVATAHDALTTAYQAVQLEQRNAQLAGEQLELARERYRVGMTSFVDLIEAETIKARADRALAGAIYAFHDALAVLEAAVGAPLRPEETAR